MRIQIKKVMAICLALSMAVNSAGCGKQKKEPKPTPRATAKVDEGNANAKGKGDNQADVPIVVATTQFSKKFNPFVAKNEADKQAVDLTQIKLVTNDRAGRLIYKGIDGELRQYGDENYTYYGASDLSIAYDDKTDQTTYKIKLRDDLVFSDGEKVTIDDVIFSMYVFCDKDYSGEYDLKNMPIQGLLNYLADSTRAEKISEKKIAKYRKKHAKSLKKWTKKHITLKGIEGKQANDAIENHIRILLAKGKGKKVKQISGIHKVSDYEMTLTTKGYSREMSKALQIPVCALHYYGDTAKFDVAKHRFGFTRGDISSVRANKTAPVGAGAYRFVKYEDGIVYFTSNELYFLGCPKIAYLQLKDITESLKETAQNLEEKKVRAQQQVQDEEQAEKGMELATLPEVEDLTGGVADVITGNFKGKELMSVGNVNSNGKISGDTIQTQLIGDGSYYYIGIHAKNVSVHRAENSEASRNLRKALATVLSVSRESLYEKDSDAVRIVNYPIASESWVSPTLNSDSYRTAYAKKVSGEDIYSGKEETQEKEELAVEAALEYLEKAGYTIEDKKAVKAPVGASLNYTVLVSDGEKNNLYPAVEKAAELLDRLGITLKIQKVDGEKLLDKKLKQGKQELWVGSRDIEDVDLAAHYGSKQETNYFGLSNRKMDRLTERLNTWMRSADRKALYQRCFRMTMKCAIEVPVCEYRKSCIFSAKRIDTDTIPQASTPYYSWLNEIQKVAME